MGKVKQVKKSHAPKCIELSCIFLNRIGGKLAVN